MSSLTSASVHSTMTNIKIIDVSGRPIFHYFLTLISARLFKYLEYTKVSIWSRDPPFNFPQKGGWSVKK